MQKTARHYGCHVSAAGGLENAIRNGVSLKVNTIQLHPAPPQRWNTKPFARDIERQFIDERRDSDIQKVFFHAIYLINLATPNDKNFEQSQRSLVNHLDLNARLEGDGVIVHVGSLKDQVDDEVGYDRAVSAIEWVLSNSDPRSKLLLEVAAGSGRIIGARMEELRRIYDGLKDHSRVGFALDSQHMWASGYDLQNDLEKIVRQIRKHFGLRKVWAIHLNDSKTELGSRRDRHENLGDGLIGRSALKDFINHPSLHKIPVILETPGLKTLETAKKEVDRLRRIIPKESR